MKQRQLIKLVTESWDRYNRNQMIGSAAIHGGLAAAHLSDVQDPGPLIAATAFGTGLAFLNLHMRDKRQKIIFKKVISRFPDAKSMYMFIKRNGLYGNIMIDPEMDDQSYGIWVARNIVKNKSFSRAVLHFLFGLGIPGAVVNGVKLANAKNSTADEIVSNRIQ